MKRIQAVIVCAVMSLVAWVILSVVFMWPPICRYSGPSKNSCFNNLKIIDAAKEQWAMAKGLSNGTPVAVEEIDGEIRILVSNPGDIPRPLRCPQGGVYTYGRIGQLPTCSLATNLPFPAAKKRRLGLFLWCWEVPPSFGPGEHILQYGDDKTGGSND